MAKDRFKIVEDSELPVIASPSMWDIFREFFDEKHGHIVDDLYEEERELDKDGIELKNGFLGNLWSGLSSICKDPRKLFGIQNDAQNDLDNGDPRKGAKNR